MRKVPLMAVEGEQARNGLDHVRRVVHHDHGSRAQTTLHIPQRIKVHPVKLGGSERGENRRKKERKNFVFFLNLQNGAAGAPWEDRNRGASGNDSLQVVPATFHSSTVLLDQLLKWDTHLLCFESFEFFSFDPSFFGLFFWAHLQPCKVCSHAQRRKRASFPRSSHGQSQQTTLLHDGRWLGPQRSSQHWPRWSGTQRHQHQRERGASGGAFRPCL